MRCKQVSAVTFVERIRDVSHSNVHRLCVLSDQPLGCSKQHKRETKQAVPLP